MASLTRTRRAGIILRVGKLGKRHWCRQEEKDEVQVQPTDAAAYCSKEKKHSNSGEVGETALRQTRLLRTKLG